MSPYYVVESEINILFIITNHNSVPKTFGDWINQGSCIGDAAHPECGPGTQLQVRYCVEGSNAYRFPLERCTDEEKRRTTTCFIAGTQLPNCPTEGDFEK